MMGFTHTEQDVQPGLNSFSSVDNSEQITVVLGDVGLIGDGKTPKQMFRKQRPHVTLVYQVVLAYINLPSDTEQHERPIRLI